jgi:hypothetical protein
VSGRLDPWAVRLSGPAEVALAALDALEAERGVTVADLRALAVRALAVPPPVGTPRAGVLAALRRPHLDRLAAVAKARAAGGPGAL